MIYDYWINKAKILWSNINISSITPKSNPEIFESVYDLKQILDKNEISDLPVNRKPFLEMFCEEIIKFYELWKENIENTGNTIPSSHALEYLDVASKLYFLILKFESRK